MSIGSTTFHPSAIEDEIYDILDSSPDHIVSSNDYTQEAIEKVIEFMSEKALGNGMEYDIIDDTHPDEEVVPCPFVGLRTDIFIILS